MKIFVTVGTQKYQFNRLVKYCDLLAGKSSFVFKIQRGYSSYKPKNCEYYDFLDEENFKKELYSSDLVICHCGTGIVFEALELGKSVIVVPRLLEFHEHKNNHQLELFEYLKENKYCFATMDVNDIEDMINKMSNIDMNNYSSKKRILFLEKLSKILNLE